MSRESFTPPRVNNSNSSRNTPNSSRSTSKWSRLHDKFSQYSSRSNTPTPNVSTANLHAPIIVSQPGFSHNQSLEAHSELLQNLTLDEPPNFLRFQQGSSSDYYHTDENDFARYSDPSFGSILTPNTGSYSSLHSANQIAHPRTTSIPRTATSKTLSLKSSNTPGSSSTISLRDPPRTPPRVEPFLYSKTVTPRKKKTIINDKCSFCEELLSSKFGSEKVIELKCGDICHEECLWLLLNDVDALNSKPQQDPNTIFPICESCGKHAIPTDETIADNIVSRYLLTTPPKQYVSQSTSSDSLIISANYELPPHPPYIQKSQKYHSPITSSNSSISSSSTPNTSSSAHNSYKHQNKFQSLSLSSKNSKDLSIHIPERPWSRTNHQRNSSNPTSQSRGSSISAISSVVSSVPKSPSPTISTFTTTSTIDQDIDTKIPLALLRAEYVTDLIKRLQKNCNRHIKDTDIDSFGLLRLVDTLLVSETGETFKELVVYLFQYNMLLVDKDYSNMLSYGLLSTPKIKTPKATTLKVSLMDSKSLYISQKSNKVLQKWIAGLCDHEFVFNSDDLSSTVELSELLTPTLHKPNITHNKNINQVENDDANTTKSIDTTFSDDDGKNFHNSDNISLQTVEVDHDDKVTIPVLLSPLKFDEPKELIERKKDAEEEDTFTFFKKTENLILVLDHSKTLSQQIIIILQNIAKVLTSKFKNLQIVYSTDSLTNIHSYGDSKYVIDDIGNISLEVTKDGNSIISDFIKDKEIEKYSLLIISNCLKVEKLSTLPLNNQLIICVQDMFKSKLDIPEKENHIKIKLWENIMEILIDKYDLSFGTITQSDLTDEDDELDSDFKSDIESDFDSDFDSDIEADFDRDDNTDDNHDDIKENCDDEDSLVTSDPSLSSVSNDNPNKKLSQVLVSDTNNFEAKNVNKSNSRWSLLFKDIDDALIETRAHLSNQIET